MKNRRTIIVAFLVMAMLVTGIGYAAVSQTLTVQGTATYNPTDAAKEFQDNIYFSNGFRVDGTGDATKDVINTTTWDEQTETAYYTIASLDTHGDYVIFGFEITNENTIAVEATLTHAHSIGGQTGGESPYVLTMCKDDEGTAFATDEKLEIPASGTAMIYVKVVLNQLPDEEVVVTQTVTIVATPVNTTNS